MGKASFSETSDWGASESGIRSAEATLQDLERGAPVGAEQVASARQAFIDGLWTGNAGVAARAGAGMVRLYELTDDAGKAGLLGEMLAQGKQGAELITQLEQFPATLSKTESESLKELAEKPVAARLHTITAWLALEADRSGGSSERRSHDRWVPQPHSALIPGTSARQDREEERLDGGVTNLERMLADASLAPEARLDAARQLGPRAAQQLVGMFQSENPAEREFASIALQDLGRSGSVGRDAYQDLRQLESQPEWRSQAEMVRRAIDTPHSERQDESGARQRAQHAGIADGWLSRAIAGCDPESIMAAATGREWQAIPLVLRTLVQMRNDRAAGR